ncbi:monovalent cation/H(+) antiporter subunit G [Xylanibacillus composti]|uniref:monovalent cation/H(+) antiporter subunit G n=1 Tax=Xylanibacillus composti TaxID=1572762 RepID=UPI001BD0F69F|nr:monovalent cation/H(+) antiporter subunit G [Xylanibacillus composti]
MDVASEWLVGLLAIAGALFAMFGTFGLIRLPDVYTRSHAATKTATLGVICVLSGAFLYFWLIEGHISAKLILGIVFVFVTAPVGGHLICRAAYRSGVPLWEGSTQDELKKRLEAPSRADAK